MSEMSGKIALVTGATRGTRDVTPDGLEETFATSRLADFLLTDLLVPAPLELTKLA